MLAGCGYCPWGKRMPRATVPRGRSRQASVAPGDTVTVTIVARDYGDLGRIVETVPEGFTTFLGRQSDRDN